MAARLPADETGDPASPPPRQQHALPVEAFAREGYEALLGEDGDFAADLASVPEDRRCEYLAMMASLRPEVLRAGRVPALMLDLIQARANGHDVDLGLGESVLERGVGAGRDAGNAGGGARREGGRGGGEEETLSLVDAPLVTRLESLVEAKWGSRTFTVVTTCDVYSASARGDNYDTAKFFSERALRRKLRRVGRRSAGDGAK